MIFINYRKIIMKKLKIKPTFILAILGCIMTITNVSASSCRDNTFVGSYQSGDGWVDTYQCPDGTYFDMVCSISDDGLSCEIFDYPQR